MRAMATRSRALEPGNVDARQEQGHGYSGRHTQARTLCGFFFKIVGALRDGFLEEFASCFLDSI